MQPYSILILLIAIIIFDCVGDKIRDFLNLRNLKPDLPEEVKGVYDEDKYKKSMDYTKTNSRFSFLT